MVGGAIGERRRYSGDDAELQPVWWVVQIGLPYREFLHLKGFVMKKMIAGAAVAASLVGISAAAAPQAMAIGDHEGTRTVNGSRARSVYGNSTTRGNLSTQLGLVRAR